jgi:hypothetical protein
MDIRAEILREHSKAQVVRIVEYVGADHDRFAKVMQLFLAGEYRVTQRLAWVLGDCAAQYPHLIAPYVGQMIQLIAQQPHLHNAVRRNVLRLLQWVEIPAEYQGLAAEISFGYLSDADVPIAVRVFAMTVLDRIAQRHPELRQELHFVLEQQLPYQSPGFVSRARKLLKR